jgi:probable HAF family extracellular repeat protein
MKSSKLARIFTASVLLFAITNLLSNAQNVPLRRRPEHSRYKIVDLGTLGGPASYESPNGEGNQILNDSGVIAFSADTTIPDPNAPDFCFNFHPDGCFVTHATRWNHGVLTDLGAIPGINSSTAGAIAASGLSVGFSENGLFDPLGGFPESRAVFWKGDDLRDLGTLGGAESLATGVTNDGQVIGMATVDETPDPFSDLIGAPWPSPTHPFIWKQGKMTDLGTLGGPDAFIASGCVNQGLAVGGSLTSSIPDPSTGLPPMHPFVWKNGKMVDLGTLGGTFGSAQCGNNRGQVIGQSSLAGDLAFHPFLWEHGVLRDLGTLGGDFGTPEWINDAGEVVGEADLPGSQVHHAFLWRKGVMTDLGTLGDDSHASAINSTSQVVGNFYISGRTEPPFRHAFLWEKGAPMIDLNTLIPANSGLELVAADNINERGEIVGVGVPGSCFPDFCGHLFLLIPCTAGDTKDCEDKRESTSDAEVQSNPSPVANGSTISPRGRLTPKDRVAAWRVQMAKRHHIPAINPPRD